ncbi:UNVERIFIED_CONTAM: hypothetical protein FKN15_040721 [Acipenser sinensis]
MAFSATYPPYSLKSRLAVPAQEQGKQGVSGGGHGGMSSSHPNNCSVPVDHAQAGSTGQKNFGASSCPSRGSSHSIYCRMAGLVVTPAKQDPREATVAAANLRQAMAAAADPREATAAAADPREATAADPREVTAAAADPREANSGGEPLAMEAAAGAPLLPGTL